MSAEQPKNPLHGITLERILDELVAFFGWEELGRQVRIRCFNEQPSVASSLKFLRRTPWARSGLGTVASTTSIAALSLLYRSSAQASRRSSFVLNSA